MKTTKKLWIGLVVLALLSPIGLYVPDKLKAGSAWGEWSADEIKGLVGYVPAGLEKLSPLWNAAMHDYAFKGWGEKGREHLCIAYITAALVGVALCVGSGLLLGKILSRKRSKKNNGFIEKTILGTVSLLRETVAGEAVASRTGFLQRCDPRFKLTGMALLLIGALFTKSITVLAVLYLAAALLAVCSSLSPQFFLKRTLLFIPLFSLFIIIPALFNVVTPGEPLVSLKFLAGLKVSITKQGVDSVCILFMRILASVSLSVLTVLTTRRHVLLKTLRLFKVPRIFIMMTGMSYRYIFLFLDVILNTFYAIKSRVGNVRSAKAGQRIVALNMAGLWLRSYRIHGQVYGAMIARGFTGEPVTLEEFHARLQDHLFLIAAFLTLLGTLWLNRFFH
jgi:cobalt/nickel transport system permease protein